MVARSSVADLPFAEASVDASASNGSFASDCARPEPEDRASQEAQRAWADRPLAGRIAVLRQARHRLATRTDRLTAAISPSLTRTPADTLAAEILPLLAAFRFLERSAADILRPRVLGSAGRPIWLRGVAATVERMPLGTILVIGPANYPLFLPGVQVLQALAAGNRVLWKPGAGGRPVALLVAQALTDSGLPAGLLTVTAEDTAAAESAIDQGVDKIILTGSAATGRAVLHRAAESLTPVVAELSGADALIVLPGADLEAVTDAIVFGLRLNGSATCMAPRRLLLMDASTAAREALFSSLLRKLGALAPVTLPRTTSDRLRPLLAAAEAQGAHLLAGGWTGSDTLAPTILIDAQPTMELTRTDLFAPVLSVLDVQGEAGVLAAQRACPLALTAAIFGDPRAARQLARKLNVGVVLINDVLITTADPRLTFGGRNGSGFGSTRGAEGLLEMTAPRVIAVQQAHDRRRFQPTNALHIGLFTGVAALLYAGTLNQRWRGLKTVIAAGRALSTPRRSTGKA